MSHLNIDGIASSSLPHTPAILIISITTLILLLLRYYVHSSSVPGPLTDSTRITVGRNNKNHTKYRDERHGPYPFPPGPKGLPIIGNLLDLPTQHEWLTYADWGKIYGPIIHVEVFGRHIVILNSYETMSQLLDKRSGIYSDRPRSVMMMDWMRVDWLTTLLNCNDDRFSIHRSLLQKCLQPSVLKSASESYLSIPLLNTHRLLDHLRRSPEKFMVHIRSSITATIMMLAYGYEIASENDEFVSLADEGLKRLSKAIAPGQYWVEFMPWLKIFPTWFPGMKWKKDAKEAYEITQKVLHVPFDFAKRNFVNGTGMHCFVSKALENEAHGRVDKSYNDDIIAECMTTMYFGGADTTVSSVQSVVLALTLHPHILECAQAEIDRVVGKDRLPNFDDRASLPYIEGIVRESLRWNPVIPLGVPHKTNADDVYNGYLIPAGSTVIANQWAVLHDESMYPNPFEFRPERWLNDEGKILENSFAPMHPNKVAFGFGRRICPGKYLAEYTIFIEVACMIAVFDFKKAVNASGEPITPLVKYGSGLVSDPHPFECSIRPRSATAEILINQFVDSVHVR